MSVFPYSQVSPPPTAGPLNIIDRANENTPYNGGGGGSAGPNLVVSTITINPTGAILMTNTPLLSSTAYLVGYQDIGSPSTTTLGVNFPSGYANKNGTPGVWSITNEPNGANYYGDFAAGRFAVLGNNSGTAVSVPVIDADQNGQMSINAVSTINFSTPTLLLNGTPVGGSATSTFNQLFTSTFGSPDPISIDMTIIGANGVNNLVFDMTSPTLSQLLFSVSTATSLGITGPTIAAVDLGANNYQFNIGGISAGGGNVVTSISSLSVSSINGAAPGGGGSAAFFSTLGIPGGAGASTFVCDPATNNPLLGFSTTAGHVYSATLYARAQVFGAPANGDLVYTEILDNNTGNDPLGSWAAQSVSTLSAGGNYQQVGGSISWKAGGANAAFNVVPGVSTLVRIDGVNLIDFGAI